MKGCGFAERGEQKEDCATGRHLFVPVMLFGAGRLHPAPKASCLVCGEYQGSTKPGGERIGWLG